MLTDLADVCRSSGLQVVEVDGWRSRGYAGRSLAAVRGVLWHHTATGRAAFDRSDAPTLSLCTNGRSDLPGPLCQLVVGRSGTVYVVAAGLANHAGTGNAAGIPTNTGNSYFIGIEMESSGVAPYDWTPEQLDAAPRLGAALERAYLQWLPEAERLQLAHYEYSNAGKIDPAGWPGGMGGLRASINGALAGVSPAGGGTVTPIRPEEDDMPDMNTFLNHAAYDNGPTISEVFRDVYLILQPGEGGKRNAGPVFAALAAIQGQNAGLLEAIKQLAASPGGFLVDLDAVTEASRKGALEALAGGFEITPKEA